MKLSYAKSNVDARALTHDNSLISSKSGFYLEMAGARAQSLLHLEKNHLLSMLSKYGAVLLRDFKADLTAFSSLVERITPKTAIDPARAFFAKNVQLVDSGLNEIGLHCENGTTPLVPNVVWFFCERAAVSGSQTTLCDGIELWRSLSPRAQALFLNNRIQFSRNVKRELWMKYVKHHFAHLASLEEINQQMLDDVFGNISGAKARINSDGSLHLSQAVFAAHPTFWGHEIAFANSLFTPSHNYEAPKIAFENGDEFPEWLLSEARMKSDLLTKEVLWKSGDIILIDNTRVMHGRRRITDSNRKLFTALGFLLDMVKNEISPTAFEETL